MKKIKVQKYAEIAIYIAIAIAVVILAYTIYTGFIASDHTAAKYEKAVKSENKENICAAPTGYTDESWSEHMSHHPEQYKECLENK